MYSNTNGKRSELLRTDAYVGKNGCSTDKREGDGKTPVGVYGIRRGFGPNTPPAVHIAYTQLQGGEQWVDDVASARYSQWVTKDTTPVDWKSAEDLTSETVAYKYVAVIEYNTDKIVNGAGSAIFLHCSKGRPTSGCVSVSEEAMIKILGLISPAHALPLPARTQSCKASKNSLPAAFACLPGSHSTLCAIKKNRAGPAHCCARSRLLRSLWSMAAIRQT